MKIIETFKQNGKTHHKFQCPGCGKIAIAATKRSNLIRQKSCGCLRQKRTDLTGKVFGCWTVEGFAGYRPGLNPYWWCVCQCGTKKMLAAMNLKRGNTTSCGCLRNHGKSKTPEHYVWTSMIQRCTNPKWEGWHSYGGRGIKVCKEWRDFRVFLKDVGERPSPKHTIERIDNNGHYEPGNVRWATTMEQGRNRRNNRWITHKGETLHVAEWARRLKVSPTCIQQRLKKGRPVDWKKGDSK